jgi:hypothetical protein
MYSFEQVRQNLDGAAISTYTLVMLIVPLKFACRFYSGQGLSTLGWDDVFVAIACVFANSFFWTTMTGTTPHRIAPTSYQR